MSVRAFVQHSPPLLLLRPHEHVCTHTPSTPSFSVHGRFTIIFEHGLERVEHLTRGASNQTYSNILAKVMKELAILGFASFAVLIAAQNMSSDDSHSPAMINFVSVSHDELGSPRPRVGRRWTAGRVLNRTAE